MARVSDVTIAAAALAAGWPRDRASMAVAVALAESGGNASATNTNTNGSTDYGLWQINSVHRADLDSGSWQDPVDNARMAYAVYRRAGNSFSPWYAWRNGRHLPFMTRAATAVDAAALGGHSVRPSDEEQSGEDGKWWVPDYIEDLQRDVDRITDTFGTVMNSVVDVDFWIRAGMMAAGVIIALVGLVAVFYSTGLKTRLQRQQGGTQNATG